MEVAPPTTRVAIACGGTGGHLFPGLVVGEELLARGCDLTLLVSAKAVDQAVVRTVRDATVVTLPAVGLERGRLAAFVRGAAQSYRAARDQFRAHPVQAVLALGGFTSAPPVLAALRQGAVTFLHEANAIPGRANRWLAHVVSEAFVYFPDAARRLWHQRVRPVGMPVRAQFEPAEAAACRLALGLEPERPTLLITGGSQGATGLNALVTRALPSLAAREPDLQFLHLTGTAEVEAVRARYTALQRRARVLPFLTEMELALGAATVAVSRAGASSLAECAAMRVPAVLIPYPAAADDHQRFNARAFAGSGAARVLDQETATPEQLIAFVREGLHDAPHRRAVQAALARWHFPRAAADIAEAILQAVATAPQFALSPHASSCTAPTLRVPLAAGPRLLPP